MYGLQEEPSILVLLLVWALSLLISIAPAKRHFGTIMVGGSPRWAYAVNVPAQLLILPIVFALACHHKRRTVLAWLSGATDATTGRQTYEFMFAYLFAAMLAKDYLLFELSPQVHLHHLACCLGHFFVFTAVPQGVPMYFAGAVALEFGSAFCNLYVLAKTAPGKTWLIPCGAVCFPAITLSHILALYFGCLGVGVVEHVAGQMFYLLLTFAFVVLRQRWVMGEIQAIQLGHQGKMD